MSGQAIYKQLFCDLPYNIGFNYKGGYKDNIKEENYNMLIWELLDYSYKLSNNTSNMFLINYREIVANLYETIKTTDWNIHQWINWVYQQMLVIVKIYTSK